MKSKSAFGLVIGSLLVAACGNYRVEKGGGGERREERPGGGPATPGPETTNGGPNTVNPVVDEVRATYASIQAKILDRKCTECHKGAHPDGDVDLTRYGRFVDPPVVRAGDPEGSTLYTSLIRERSRMPKNRDPLSAKEIKAVYDWIKAGAPRN